MASSKALQLIVPLLAVALLSQSAAAQEAGQLQVGENDVAPFMIVTTHNTITKVDINGSNPQTLIRVNTGGITAVDYHYRRGLFFYLTESPSGLYSYNLFPEATGEGSQRDRIQEKNVDFPVGLAVDWINDKVYWIDRDKRTLEVYDIESETTEELIRFDGDQMPQGISILPYPDSGWLFVMARRGRGIPNDHGNTELFRIPINDTSRKERMRGELCSKKLTVDNRNHMLLWIDDCQHDIEASRLDGMCGARVFSLGDPSSRILSSGGLVQYSGDCFYTQAGEVYRKGADQAPTPVYSVGSRETLTGLAVVHPSMQPPATELRPFVENESDKECPTNPPPESCDPPCSKEKEVSVGSTTAVPNIVQSLSTTEPTTLGPTTEESTTATTRHTTQSPTTEESTTVAATTATTRPATESPTTEELTTLGATTKSLTTNFADHLSTTESTTTETSTKSVTLVLTTQHATTHSVSNTQPPTTPEVEPTSESAVGGVSLPTSADGLNRMTEEAPSSMVLIVISVCVVLFLVITVASASYLFLIIFKHYRRRRGSYNVIKRRRGDESSTPLARNSFRAFTDYHPSAFSRVNQNTQATTLTGSSSVESFERMSIGSPMVVHCRYHVTEAEVQPQEEAIIFGEVTEGEIQPAVAARPEVVQVGSISSAPPEDTNKRQRGCGTLYASEQREMYFSL